MSAATTNGTAAATAMPPATIVSKAATADSEDEDMPLSQSVGAKRPADAAVSADNSKQPKLDTTAAPANDAAVTTSPPAAKPAAAAASSDSDSDSDSDGDVPLMQTYRPAAIVAKPAAATVAKPAAAKPAVAVLAKPAAPKPVVKAAAVVSKPAAVAVVKKPAATAAAAAAVVDKKKRTQIKEESDEEMQSNNDDDDDDDNDNNSDDDGSDEESEDSNEDADEGDSKPAARKSNGSSNSSKSSSSKSSSSSSSTKGTRRTSTKTSTNADGVEFQFSELHDASAYEVQPVLLPLLATKGANKWWQRDNDASNDNSSSNSNGTPVTWTTLQHNGVLFPPAYVQHHQPLLYRTSADGVSPVTTVAVLLGEAAEEAATFYAKILESEHPRKPVFNSNFWSEFKVLLLADYRQQQQQQAGNNSSSSSISSVSEHPILKQMSRCDFSAIKSYLDSEKERQKMLKKKHKYLRDAEKTEKLKLAEIYGHAIVDGYREKVGNFVVELPGLFLGRGQHPKTGRIKKRIMPEDITINISVGQPIPAAPTSTTTKHTYDPAGNIISSTSSTVQHQWRGVCHNNIVTWLAYWSDNVNESHKYMYLHASSKWKGQSDVRKYSTAIRLKSCIDRIRASYTRDLKSQSRFRRQRAVAMYLIDRLALRVGNEKNTEEEADTVGCCSLRVEHLSFPTDDNTEENEPATSAAATAARARTSNCAVTFDFLGKDSMPYFNTVELDPVVYNCLRSFCEDDGHGVAGSPDRNVFNELDVSALNEHLKTHMHGLSAKVFRTYNASITLQQELSGDADSSSNSNNDTVAADADDLDKLAFYNRANRTVAILCNHQKTVSKGHDEGMRKMEAVVDSYLDEIAEVKEALEQFADSSSSSSKSKKVKKEDAAAAAAAAAPVDKKAAAEERKKRRARFLARDLQKEKEAREKKERDLREGEGVAVVNSDDDDATPAAAKGKGKAAAAAAAAASSSSASTPSVKSEEKKRDRSESEIQSALAAHDREREQRLQRMERSHLAPDDESKCRVKLDRLNASLSTQRSRIAMKDDSKTVSLGTSKINYMDPRITVAWCKAKGLAIEKIFPTALTGKFPWAMEVASTWKF